MAPRQLPSDIVTEIIHRLPFRQVVLCKLVSKHWKNLINHPLFYTLYRDNTHTTFFFIHNVLYCICISDRKNRITGCNFPPFTVHPIPISPAATGYCFGYPKLVGLSCGIACVNLKSPKDAPFLLYNWFTGSSDTVAGAPGDRFAGFDFHGFGYDPYGHDYKIFVRYYWGHPKDEYWIYSCRNKQWSSFQGFPCGYLTLQNGAHSFNGVLHWAHPEEWVIVTYDLHTNRFGEIPVSLTLPASILPSDHPNVRVSVSEFDGQLCYVCKIGEGFRKTRMDVWVMKEYGVGDSWERFTTMSNPKLKLEMIPTILLYRCKGGGRKALFLSGDYGNELIWCNIDNNNVRSRNREKNDSFDLIYYKLNFDK